jgi:hypothetical protein
VFQKCLIRAASQLDEAANKKVTGELAATLADPIQLIAALDVTEFSPLSLNGRLDGDGFARRGSRPDTSVLRKLMSSMNSYR